MICVKVVELALISVKYLEVPYNSTLETQLAHFHPYSCIHRGMRGQVVLRSSKHATHQSLHQIAHPQHICSEANLIALLRHMRECHLIMRQTYLVVLYIFHGKSRAFMNRIWVKHASHPGRKTSRN